MSEETIKHFMKNMIAALVFSKVSKSFLRIFSSLEGSCASRYQTLEYIDYQR
jgi:hypothetical protein